MRFIEKRLGIRLSPSCAIANDDCAANEVYALRARGEVDRLGGQITSAQIPLHAKYRSAPHAHLGF